ncbi:hypothetical protein [Rhodovastum atsumiense]|uniref:Uncharacterized protein n=1 Tax=Rhodovastum atsumiense TaxID=504468 RepID=A0A5M6INV1_9PROT|nr:hypothetical protein [Rhodovastum atsumiense]KAA5609931.1 hypothetical protein F1189_21810 [Rhodovastum atsumiense]
MKLLLLLIVVAVSVAFLYPPYAEDSETSCAAFEHRVKALADAQIDRVAGDNPRLQSLLGTLKGAAPTGLFADAYIHHHFPSLPPTLACTVAYWRTVQTPDLRRLAGSLMP